MLGLSEIKSGRNIILKDVPYAVLYHEHSKTGRAGSVLRTRLKNLQNGAILEKTFQGADKISEADINKSKAQFLYREKEKYCFMDMESYEQFSLSEKVLASAKDYLVEGTEMTVLNFNSQPINIELPVKIALRVVEAPPNVRGNTVSSGGKIITLETGLKISAPLFIKEGEKIIVNTERGEYVSRV
ncbi:MAG: elongation factor P [Candidatus Moranbacteria bacterium CG_4_9_14_3_um_filter_40_7]|nr:MAG: elongation factor P [Candidatus Moranbacteria bacterium CG23_combo_of_CG06-09_8_20_14_all_40_16]PIU80647.1 MAG: elongation factor P [Candidatus Moranbacteria bacterium CG06_land_8_20_14_3_00_40_12]PJA88083.1 MAG: elongation factor P [Candidatus Moranbacteria bacterium CG_4_9_14_3_um_filter_40_7]